MQVEKDTEEDVTYVRMKDPSAPEIVFVRSPCPSRQVLKVACAELGKSSPDRQRTVSADRNPFLECGVQPTRSAFEGGGGPPPLLPKMSAHGDWPWHAALIKDDVHLCDGVLVSSRWVVTSTSCFQGQPRAEWRARLAAVRLTGSSPWEQERRIVGMVKSPVEGSTLAMAKLETEIVLNDFVRPICLAGTGTRVESAFACNALGWSKNRDQLQRVQVRVAEAGKCDNISISSVNGLCAETAYGQEDCNVRATDRFI